MYSYLTSYDLVGQPKEYEPLWDSLRKAGAVRILESVWVFDSTMLLDQVYAALNSLIKAQDRLVVVPVTANLVRVKNPLK